MRILADENVPKPIVEALWVSGQGVLTRLHDHRALLEVRMRNECVEQREGDCYVMGRRVSLEVIVCCFPRGESAASVVDSESFAYA